MNAAMMISEAVLLAAALSLDAFIASFAYGSSKIKIPLSSVLAINAVCSGILGASLFLGSVVRPYLSPDVSRILCFGILFVIGLAKLLDHITKAFIRRHSDISADIRFSVLNFKFILSVYADPEKSDVDHSKSISMTEAVSLAAALSLDGMAAGFGAALGNVSGIAVFLSSFVTDTAAVVFGSKIGNRVAGGLRFNLSWASGAVLIVMAFLKLL